MNNTKPYGYVIKNANGEEVFSKDIPELIDQLSVTAVYVPLWNVNAIGTVNVYRWPSLGGIKTDPYITVSWMGNPPSHGDLVYTINSTPVEVKE